MRPDGCVRVSDLVCVIFRSGQVYGNLLRRGIVKLASPRLSSPTQLDLPGLQRIVENDSKKRYMLLKGPDDTSPTTDEIWWIRANQGHSLKVPLDICLHWLKPR